jgi:hypothetical protein
MDNEGGKTRILVKRAQIKTLPKMIWEKERETWTNLALHRTLFLMAVHTGKKCVRQMTLAPKGQGRTV